MTRRHPLQWLRSWGKQEARALAPWHRRWLQRGSLVLALGLCALALERHRRLEVGDAGQAREVVGAAERGVAGAVDQVLVQAALLGRRVLPPDGAAPASVDCADQQRQRLLAQRHKTRPLNTTYRLARCDRQSLGCDRP